MAAESGTVVANSKRFISLKLELVDEHGEVHTVEITRPGAVQLTQHFNYESGSKPGSFTVEHEHTGYTRLELQAEGFNLEAHKKFLAWRTRHPL